MLRQNVILAKMVYLYFRVYQHYLQDHGLDDDTNAITCENLVDFVKNHIDPDERKRLELFCAEAY